MGGTLEKTAGGLRYRVDRGPNWLFVKLTDQQMRDRNATLAEDLWGVCVQHFTYRLVLEMDDVKNLPAGVTKQLEELRERLTALGGALRLCGANEDCQQTLSGVHQAVTLKSHANRAEAVQG